MNQARMRALSAASAILRAEVNNGSEWLGQRAHFEEGFVQGDELTERQRAAVERECIKLAEQLEMRLAKAIVNGRKRLVRKT